MAAPLRAHRIGGHCGSAALRDLLEHHGLDYGAGPLTESQVFVLAGGLSLLFSEQAAGVGMYLFGRSQTLEVDLCAHLGIACEQRSTHDPDLAWSWVQREVDRGSPTMVWADIAHLDYLDVRMQNSNHDVIVVGYDVDAGEVLLADHALPGVQRCGLASFEAARASGGFPGPHCRRTWFMEWPEALPPADEAVAAGVRAAAEHALHGEPGTPYTTGLSALAELRAVIAAAADLDEIEQRDWFRRLWFCIEKAGTGGGFYRVLWSDGLHRMAELLDDPELRGLGDHYAELAGEWSAFARAGLRRQRRDPVRAAAARTAHIERLENEGARGLAAW